MDNVGITPVMPVNGGYGDGLGMGGSGIWLFAILALMWGGFGGNRFGGNFDGRYATVEDINNSANFTRLESQVQGNNQELQDIYRNINNGICSLGYEMAQQFGNTNTRLSECCCGINRNIDGVRYENALNTASINANTTAGVQKILDKMCENEKSALIQRINYLEMQNLVQPPRPIPAYPACNPYTGTSNGCCGY